MTQRFAAGNEILWFPNGDCEPISGTIVGYAAEGGDTTELLVRFGDNIGRIHPPYAVDMTVLMATRLMVNFVPLFGHA